MRQITIRGAKDLAEGRDMYRCQRCGSKGTEWHHRRPRGVKDSHTNCVCNALLLCHDCHAWITTHPSDAKKHGWSISRYQPDPYRIPVMRIDHGKPCIQDCQGNVHPAL